MEQDTILRLPVLAVYFASKDDDGSGRVQVLGQSQVRL
jgi:hypothetical protein